MYFNNDEDLFLSSDTLLALSQFLKEKEQLDEANISENWQLSQFWYNNETTEKLAEEVIIQKNDFSKIVCISCPTLHMKLVEKNISSTLLEFDSRFNRYPEFFKYDYNAPLDLPSSLEGQFDIIILDPPFLSEECLTKTSETVKWLSKQNCSTKIILCTGKIQQELAFKLLEVTQCKNFEPKHENRLSNEFGCFVNFETIVLDK